MNVGVRGRTPLVEAVAGGHDIVADLLAAGADPNVHYHDDFSFARYPLSRAALDGNLRIVDQLLAAADIDASDSREALCCCTLPGPGTAVAEKLQTQHPHVSPCCHAFLDALSLADRTFTAEYRDAVEELSAICHAKPKTIDSGILQGSVDFLITATAEAKALVESGQVEHKMVAEFQAEADKLNGLLEQTHRTFLQRGCHGIGPGIANILWAEYFWA